MLSTSVRRLSASAPTKPSPAWFMAAETDASHVKPAPSSAREALIHTARRIQKAEQDERMDITRVLTPPKTYRGGFTRPSHIRSAHWFNGGHYTESGQAYEPPSSAAYQPHTVFLLESRHPIAHPEPGRTDVHEHIVGVCREGDFPAVMAKFNSTKAPDNALELMDSARWPWVPAHKEAKRTVWWQKGEDPTEVVEHALERRSESIPAPAFLIPPSPKRRSKKQLEKVSVNLLTPASLKGSNAQRRAFHSSATRLASDVPKSEETTTAAERANIPTSSWARPHKPSQDADDNVVPVYYIERKRQRDTIAERKEEEGGLMAELSAGILSEGVAAQTKVLPEKIPVEVKMADGTVRHPSGFEPPTPETDFHPVASKVATEEDPLLTTVKVTWDDALSPSPDVLEALEAASSSASAASSSKHIRSFSTSACARAFEIPYSSYSSSAPPPPPAAAAELASSKPESRSMRRKQYLAALEESPFWRPILSLTFTTRPLATTIARLSRGLERGTPFYASIPEEDRKHGSSYSARLRSLRIARMQNLTSTVSRALQGERGGVPGIRFNQTEKGRGVGGEALASPIEAEKRKVKVGVAEWYHLAPELKEAFELDAQAAGTGDACDVFGLDEKGFRTDSVAWRQESKLESVPSLEEAAMTREEMSTLTRKQKQNKLDQYAAERGEEYLQSVSSYHKGVIYP